MKTMFVSCCGCGEQVKCFDEDILTKDVTMSDGKDVTITQWRCPKCGFLHTLDVDNTRTKELFSLLKRKAAEVDRVQRDLNIARAAIRSRYDGSFYQLDGQKFKLELCIPDATISGEEETTNA